MRRLRTSIWARGAAPRRSPCGGPDRRACLVLDALEDRLLMSCTLSLSASEPSPQLVGERITWAARATDCAPDLVYQFRVGPTGLPSQMARDFNPDNTFQWTPMQEGLYDITVLAKAGYRGMDTFSARVSDQVNSRVTGSDPVITPTANPLVALYSAPACADGTIHVEFTAADLHGSTRSTDALPCEPGLSRNFLVAGLLPNTTYQMQYVTSDGSHAPPLWFTTGTLSTALQFPTFSLPQPPDSQTDLTNSLILHFLITRTGDNTANPVAVDLKGHVTWYYDVSQSGLTGLLPVSLVPGGNTLLFGIDRYSSDPNTVYNVLREIDLAGNPVRETNMDVVNAQLLALGHKRIYGFEHDARRLRNGATAILATTHRTVIVNGMRSTYVGEDLIVLNRNFQVTWVWDAFDYMDVNRGPILGETDLDGNVDWLHVNAISWSPADGNIILSMRHQDWVVKIDYRSGSGDGHVIWRLGLDGDFTVTGSDDPYPWFSHQHDAKYVDDTTLVLFDNGNTRCLGDPNCHNRGQAWTLDEKAMTATPVVNADLGVFSPVVGAAQRLASGHYSFTSGQVQTTAKSRDLGQTFEVLPDGSATYVQEEDETGEYRSYRLRSMYAGTVQFLDAGSDGGLPVGGNAVATGTVSDWSVAFPAASAGLAGPLGVNDPPRRLAVIRPAPGEPAPQPVSPAGMTSRPPTLRRGLPTSMSGDPGWAACTAAGDEEMPSDW